MNEAQKIAQYKDFISLDLSISKIYADTCCKLINQLANLEKKYHLYKPSDLNNEALPSAAKSEILSLTHKISDLVDLYYERGTSTEYVRLTHYQNYKNFPLIDVVLENDITIKDAADLIIDKFKSSNSLIGIMACYDEHAEPVILAYNNITHELKIAHNNISKHYQNIPEELKSEYEWNINFVPKFKQQIDKLVEQLKSFDPQIKSSYCDLDIPRGQHIEGGYCVLFTTYTAKSFLKYPKLLLIISR